ncbi:MAG: hypothetical protein WAZ40_00060 [Minisyncoccia bacterium]
MNQFLPQKAHIQNHKGEEWLRFEKILLTVDSGTLILTVSIFTGKIGLVDTWILGGSWLYFSASIISLLIGYLVSEFHSSQKLMRIDNNQDPYSVTILSRILDSGLVVTNWLSGLCATIGLILLASFGYLNLTI